MMETKIMKTGTDHEIALAVSEAAKVLQNGGVVAIPTETVYGLACSGYSESGIKSVFTAKGRPQDNPLILHISDTSELDSICKDIPDTAYMLADEFWPGPLTMILPKKPNVPYSVSAGLETVAVRCPSHKIANLIIKSAGVPLAAPSANLSGKPSTTSVQHVIDDLSGRVPLIIDGGDCRVGLESTIIDLTVTPPAVLRPGEISAKQLASVIGEVLWEGQMVREQDIPKAPGMKYRHYAPSAPLTAVNGSASLCADYIAQVITENDGVICFDRFKHLFKKAKLVISSGSRHNLSQYAHVIFSALRQLDDKNINHIYVQCTNSQGVGMAILNRLKKASGGDIRAVHKTKIIGITGDSGSGKTTASQFFQSLGATIIDCDRLYHNLTITNARLKDELCQRFGNVYDENCKLDRYKLGQIVFSDKNALNDLNAITHKYIMEEIEREIDIAERKLDKMVILDAPTLFESGAYLMCDKTIAIVSNNDTMIDRVAQRDGISSEYANCRISAQQSNDFFCKNADIIVDNNSSKEDYIQKLSTIYNQLSQN